MKKVIVVTLAIHLAFGAMSSYRAWVQVRALTLDFAGPTLQRGSSAHLGVVSSGRVPIDVRLEVVQGRRAETLAVLRVPNNPNPFWDPRARRAALDVAITSDMLAKLRSGPGLLRAVARGRPQWMREPPPLVREVALQVRP